MADGVNAEEMDSIYREHAATVYKFLLAQCGSEQLAEELTQETFYQAVRCIGRYDGSCKLSTWLCQIAKHLWYRQLRHARREAPSEDPWQQTQVPTAPAPDDAVQMRWQHMQLLRSIHVLPEPSREVVYLRVFGELSFAEIGDVMGKSENWARVTFYRSKEKLRGQERGEE